MNFSAPMPGSVFAGGAGAAGAAPCQAGAPAAQAHGQQPTLRDMNAARSVNPIFHRAPAAASAAAPVAAAAAVPASAAAPASAEQDVQDLTGEMMCYVRVHASDDVRVCIGVTDCVCNVHREFASAFGAAQSFEGQKQRRQRGGCRMLL